ncbi:tail protein X [Xenorhabdus griffiniae]|uniref:Tail protein X n=1 Tax=Xenorhabdus griffiniae TaxID=351672 RepID=A0ABY9XKC9_9GAMM|nr:tail protein X [Xenorhabdus griffiniae]MBD1229249.1 tail protein X [Xenorhabdus griffiniae]MBE8587980.1 tail protein X [Xenorhabdus griffiniae]WMV73395.1 tail protein X [Xenorhabdus griffiniae]WNH03074.1 tail protein X [Xenorhabdus griffiniae]
MQVIAQQNETVDAICWRHYGRTLGMTERVLLANPGLADFGAVLPHGTKIEMPDFMPVASKPIIQLWD